MSFLKNKEFSEMYGVKPTTLRVHINRGKLVKQKGGLIDTDHPVNKEYIRELNSKKPAPQPTTKPVANEEIEYTPKQTPAPTPKDDGDYTNLTMREKVAKTLKVEREAEYKRLQNLKMQGKLMPIELVEKTQTINIQSIFRSFESGAENIASIYNERLGGNRADLADMITRMRQELERAIDNAKQKSREEIKGLLEEYAATLNRGEKK